MRVQEAVSAGGLVEDGSQNQSAGALVSSGALEEGTHPMLFSGFPAVCGMRTHHFNLCLHLHVTFFSVCPFLSLIRTFSLDLGPILIQYGLTLIP